jgi:hypothetical protein
MDNVIEIATAAGSLSGGNWQTGIRLGTTQSAIRWNQAILRRNIIRDVQTPLGVTTNLAGVDVQRCAELIAENNIISNIAETLAMKTQNCTSTKFFNNQNQAGQLLRGYAGSQRVLELEDAAQDVLIVL